MREGRKRPDRLPALIEAHRQALATCRAQAGGPVFLAGKSMGSRVGCHLALEEPVAGVICFGFPLVSGTSGARRDEVLLALRTPILLVQGSRDPLCPLDLLAEVRARMTAPATLLVVEGGDHSLVVSATHRKATGTTQAQADARVLDAVQTFVEKLWWQNEAVSKTRRPKAFRDVAAICGKDERGLHILRRRSDDGPIEAGILQPLVEGKPIAGEVISMKQRQDVPFLFDVETQVAAAPEAPEASGPAQVATESTDGAGTPSGGGQPPQLTRSRGCGQTVRAP